LRVKIMIMKMRVKTHQCRWKKSQLPPKANIWMPRMVKNCLRLVRVKNLTSPQQNH
jgi:hypothetical protein